MIIKAYRWYGGKIRMAHIINFLIPKHTAYYEPFMGSASVLLNHPRSSLEVVNDLDPDLSHFMKTLADREKGKILVERLCGLFYGREYFLEAQSYQKLHYKGLDEIERAVMVFTLITQSFNALRKNFSAKLFSDTYEYRQDIQFHIPKVYERLKDVHVLNKNGIDILERIAHNPNAFAFTDPPYRTELRGKGADKSYACELPHKEQVRLLNTIKKAECKIMLCGYRTDKGEDLYDRYLKPFGWKCYRLADVPKSCQSGRKKHDIGHEYIWVNYELPPEAKYVISMEQY